ncbi:ATP-dependent RNA helicase CHL1 [Hyphopichia burtonii NRRL Y-1933]|uniref:ATP-dependent DNA helicase CHL1 n=1 Tax=Hyphopichia burtonii NRRL Y-1933 TaxID=984485 RepID=A0A1E4RGX9_9ASCO|nr:ATP-dependent RNA helicase CHL1 [Hyphopichia burtonii NRRL Y-1933]ODV66519.1 ATP-dependent RNA helicase CHL1 [Hyphopichia burtonii NRRL Y-1933]
MIRHNDMSKLYSSQKPNPYSHPYTPYPIQIELMQAIYDTINNDFKIGLFESPTGTGKTLSIICSTMTWLRDYKKNHVFSSTSSSSNPAMDASSKASAPSSRSSSNLKELNFSDSSSEEDSSDEEPEWVKKSYEKTVIARTKGRAEEYEIYLDTVSKRYKKSTVHDLSRDRTMKKMKKLKTDTENAVEDDYLPEDYYSDSENGLVGQATKENNQLSSEIEKLLSKVNGSGQDQVEPINECPVSIYFSSRTHSQLTQFSHQLNLTNFPSSLDNISERIKFLPLGSRKQLCIHPRISKISNLNNLNDACVDLQNLTSSNSKGCEYLPKLNNPDSSSIIKDFTDMSLTKIHDIEDLAQLGSELKVCPYYSVRKGIELTEIVALPYQMLLQDSTRKILNLKIDNSIVIIDEAHNLLDTITAMNSLSITSNELSDIIKSLKFYLAKFLKRLNSGNRINIMKLIKLCQILINFVNKSSPVAGREISTQEIFDGNTGDLINVHKIEKFLNKSKIAYKIETYMEKLKKQESNNTTKTSSSSNPLLFKITQFLMKLNNPSKEGKFFWDTASNTILINYMLLDPSEIFKPLVTRSKCVLLCGGTMEPMNDYTDYLFPYIPNNKLKKFSCDHIIPDENLKVFPITHYQRTNFEFSFDKRNNPSMIEALGKCLVELIQSIASGVVIFFPSYKYLNQVLDSWKRVGVYDKMNNMKTIYEEPTDSSNVDSTLASYSSTIKSNHGAILFSVVGGKMSEGINFSDDLARSVIMIGLPYPNAYLGEMIARKNFIKETTISRGGTPTEANSNAQNFYENICMRAINQSVGRSIRHSKDYSTIYLIDSRFQQARIQNKLSAWVKKRIINNKNLNEILDETNEFFNSKLVNRSI